MTLRTYPSVFPSLAATVRRNPSVFPLNVEVTELPKFVLGAISMATEAKTEAATQTAAPAAANPAPLGLFSFASTTLVLSAANAGFSGVDVHGALSMALFVGGLAQLLVGMWEFKGGNTFGGVAFSSYGVFWLSFWAFFSIGANGPTAVDSTGAATAAQYNVAWYLLCWTIVTGVLLLGTLRLNLGLVVVFLLLFITFLLLTIADFNGTSHDIGGWFGIATAIAAYYVGAAGVLSSVGWKLLPVGGPIMKG
jgi:succinate-acetate transporter protein